MLRAALDGLDRRLGWREKARAASAELAKPVPRRVGWAWTLGTAALALLLVQVVTGLALSLHYQPTPEAAHRSVATILDRVRFGWIIRGVHAWGAHFIVAILLLHAAKVFVTAGHKRPRELTWVVGALILFTMMGLAFTGTLLPWTDLSYWGTVVATEQVRATPLVGPPAAAALVGGASVGAPTLTRFYVMHILVLPVALGGLIAAHLWLIRKLGVAPEENADEEAAKGHDACCEGGEPYAPNHVLRELIVATAIVGLLITVAATRPEELKPAAGLATPPGIRPEWYFLPVYQYLKYWPSRMLGIPGEAIAICVLNAAILAFVAMPFLDRSPERRASRRKLALAAGLGVALVAGVLGVLGAVAERDVPFGAKKIHFDTYGRPR